MKLFRVSPTKQDREKLLDNVLVFISGNLHLEGTFNRIDDHFLCKIGKRYFISQVNIVGNYVYFDHGPGRCYEFHELDSIHLIKEESDLWPQLNSTENNDQATLVPTT